MYFGARSAARRADLLYELRPGARLGPCMQRDELLVAKMSEAAEQAITLTTGTTTEDLHADRQRRDALLWNVTVLREAASQVSEQTRDDPHPDSISTAVKTAARAAVACPRRRALIDMSRSLHTDRGQTGLWGAIFG